MRKRAHLIERLEDAEEPVFGLFRRFFPIDYFMGHLNEVAASQKSGASSRHAIPWDKGTFLAFLGVLI